MGNFYLKKQGVPDELILFMDETKLPYEGPPKKLHGLKSRKRFYKKTSGCEKENYTLVFTHNAAGDVLFPIVLVSGKNKPKVTPLPDMEKFPVYCYASENGYVKRKILVETYLVGHVSNYTKGRRSILIYDEASCHWGDLVDHAAVQLNIMLMPIFAHHTKFFQTCDVYVFKSLKHDFNEAMNTAKEKARKEGVYWKKNGCAL